MTERMEVVYANENIFSRCLSILVGTRTVPSSRQYAARHIIIQIKFGPGQIKKNCNAGQTDRIQKLCLNFFKTENLGRAELTEKIIRTGPGWEFSVR